MSVVFLYAGALFSLAVAVVLIWGTSPFNDCGGARYEWLRRRRLAGQLFLVVAALCLVAAVAGQLINLGPG